MTQNAKGPLSGIVVVDLSRILAGPYCTLLMAEMGARVIKVEPPKGGDDARAYGTFINGKSTYFASVNRGKESIALDLKSDADRKIFEKLLEKADVVVENFRPGTMEKLGYGWETLHAKYPKLIYAAASGFGHSGPNSKDPAYDMVMQGTPAFETTSIQCAVVLALSTDSISRSSLPWCFWRSALVL